MRVLVVDRSAEFRDTLRDVLNAEDDLEADAIAADHEQAIAAAARFTPEVAVLGVDMPGREGVILVGEFQRRLPAVRLVAFTAMDIGPDGTELARLGIGEHLVKGAANVEILAAVRRAGHA
ncbi:MAG TPA: response regulator [Actinophytocola sp.]|nr:response regulator [Actinophytocola sp.]